MRIERLDPHDDEALAAWHATYLLADSVGRPHPTPWMLEEVEAELREPATSHERALFSGRIHDQVVTAASLELPLRDNLDSAQHMVFTHPEQRRRGYGSQMLAHVEEVIAARGRTVIHSFADADIDGPEDGRGHPDVEFLTSRGYAVGIGNVQRVLDLPVDQDRLRALSAQAAPRHAGYTVRWWRDTCPDDLVDSYAGLVGRLMVEAPTGDLEVEEEVFDAARVRQGEATKAAADRTAYVTVALSPAGEVVAYTELVVPRHDPGRVYQWGTLVAPEHRGHRLGLAVKARNHLFLQEHEPLVSSVSTYNAAVNDHMIAVNEQLGFRPVWRSVELQKKLA